MNNKQRIQAFVQLGKFLNHFGNNLEWKSYQNGVSLNDHKEFNTVIEKVHVYNGWFTEPMVRKSLNAISLWLTHENLELLLENHKEKTPKTIAVIMAGNIPLVGFHDALCVLLTGNKLLAKFSSDDAVLMPLILKYLTEIEPELENYIRITDNQLTNFDAVVATGSNNSSRYFEYYFSNKPHIIRKNRTSIAILDGNETNDELKKLGNDIFDYYGLGCRNVTKIFIPENFDLDRLFGAIFDFNPIINHNKYANNYDYHKAIYLMNGDKLIENGFVLLREEKDIFSPVGVLHYERYNNISDVTSSINEIKNNIQCIIGHQFIDFGKSQEPQINDFADDINTITFLTQLQ